MKEIDMALVPTEALIKELTERASSIIICAQMKTNSNYSVLRHHVGKTATCLGLADLIKESVMQEFRKYNP